MDWPSAATMSAPCAPGGFKQAERHDFRHHRDQQRALGVGGIGDGPADRGSARTRRALHHHAGGLVVDQRDDVFGACPASPALRATMPGQLGDGLDTVSA